MKKFILVLLFVIISISSGFLIGKVINIYRTNIPTPKNIDKGTDDMSTNPKDYIYPRTFGRDAKETATYIKTVVETMKDNKIGSSLKHFPGYGENLNTHEEMSVDTRSYESFLSHDFIPFKAGVDAGADSILVSHNIISSIDENFPASLSKKAHDVIRNELNFNGVIMTDDLQMSAIKNYYGESNSAILVVNSGNDLIISSDYNIQIPAVIEAVKNGDIKEEVIDNAVLKVLVLKLKLGIIYQLQIYY